jgi:hypothetical protein
MKKLTMKAVVDYDFLTMSKPVGLRRPRKEVPDDSVSCPATLNLKRSSVKRAKEFVNELVEMSPRLSDIGEKTKPDEEVSALGLASMLQSTVSSLDTTQFHPSGQKIKPCKERNIRPFKASRRSPPRSYVEGDLPPPPPNTRAQQSTSTAQRSSRAPPKTTRKQHEEAGVPATRPINYRNRRNPSVYSSVQSSMASSMVSWDSMSQSVYSVYTTATAIARRPAWGHYVVGVMVFFGWIVHHHYFSEYFQQPLYLQQTTSTLQQTLVKDDLSSNSDNDPSMLRGAMKESAVYLQQDYEKRDDYPAIKPVDAAFDTIGDTKAERNGGTPHLEEEVTDAAVGEEDSGGPPPPVATEAIEAEAAEVTTEATAAEEPVVVDKDGKCKDGSTGANCTKA